MSLLANYEGLRHQIERLVRENEELKKLVRLIRENHELKSAIKTQAGGLGISGFSTGFGQMAATPQHQGNCVFLPPSPAAAHEPVLEEVGVVALAPLADMLNSPQPGPTAGPIVSPLTGPLSTLLPGLGPMSQSGLFSSILTGPLTPSSPLARPLAVAPGGTLGSSMGTVSTGPLTPSSTLAGLMAVSPRGTLGSSMGLPSTGPPTPSSPLAGPLAVAPGGILGSSMGTASTGPLTPSSPLMAPTTGTVAISLSSPLLTSTAAPLGVSQNLVANPVSNLVLPEAQRVRLTEPFRGCPSGPPPSAGAGPAGTTKVPMSTEHPQPTQDPEPLGVTFVGVPLHTSTPMETKGAAGPGTAFSFSTSDARAQPGAPQGQAVPAPVPVAPTAAPQATTGYASPGTTHVAQCPPPSPTRAHHPPTQPSSTPHSPPRNPHSPPRTSSSPASVNDPRGPRGTETSRKSMAELERKLAHRKISRFPDSPRESRQLAWERLVGEIAFQLDRRILSSIFPERVRLYGFTVSNIPEKIIQASLNPGDHKLDEELCQTLTQRYVSIMNRLQSLGYDGRVHPALTEQLVNAYGILRERPELAASEGGSYTVDFLQRVLVETVHPSMLTDALLLLSCLNQLAHDDGKPMFIW
ncbi:speriolin [Prionailurus viverrinus]|uniref:speriolin n=1 Tax=Prionailurus viverrinus TaxID=61388 RepID=UPI001FF36162|nr:speriolin [Prionailurus viverrinus]XP_047698033.1 speriolin [Prionailurus viverrinus]XP_047698034.1 speriolin [Prionailurus viverrinus]XP_047698035.1 speriolin [Prionailurus viverrinus]XP_047698036.1 speriolin [Prionailurus viverrinus]XP_047698037.1 speriolin [Prionailurus viverrinus]XP_047698038.1 speriolin [Prionailurus viverrinus]XP_047698039.1 speriolin [Prionailurus viverrinus]